MLLRKYEVVKIMFEQLKTRLEYKTSLVTYNCNVLQNQ